jgi:hypothetical protein
MLSSLGRICLELQIDLRQFPITIRTGTRPTWCIERRGITFWLGSIQVANVRAEIRPRLLDF